MARRSRRGPVGPTISQAAPRGKCSSAELGGELLVVGLVVVPADALLGHAGGAAGLEDVVRPALVMRRHPHLGLQVAQPLVLEMRESRDEVGERLHLPSRVPAGLARPIEPERAAGLGREVPRDDLAHVRVERTLGGLDNGSFRSHRDCQAGRRRTRTSATALCSVIGGIAFTGFSLHASRCSLPCSNGFDSIRHSG